MGLYPLQTGIKVTTLKKYWVPAYQKQMDIDLPNYDWALQGGNIFNFQDYTK